MCLKMKWTCSIHNSGSFVRQLDFIHAVMETLADGLPPFMLDVAQPVELEEKGHIEGAVNIPLLDFGKNMDNCPTSTPP